MSELRISAGSTSLRPTASSGGGVGGGSAAQRAYTRAVKQLVEAQKKLAQDGANHASDDVIKADQLAVDLAANAVQLAQAALAKEQDDSRSSSSSAQAAPAAAAAGRLRSSESRLDVLS